jgi:hypothetical protein
MKKYLLAIVVFPFFFQSCNSGAKEPSSTMSGNSLPADSVKAIAKNAYVYGIALALMDITAKRISNVEAPVPGIAAPINQFAISDVFPDAKFRAVVRPNADTYYTSGVLDLGADAMVLSLPNTNGRYYLMPMLDAYSNVFASPGKRTTGTQAGTFLLTGPKWTGNVPADMKEIKSPTNAVWIIGRTQVNSPEDGTKFVVPLEKKYILTPLSAWGKPYTAPKGTVNPNISKESPNDQVKNMPIDSFFNYVNRLLVSSPPPASDNAALSQFNKIGIGPGAKFDLSSFDTAAQAVLKTIPQMVFGYMDDVLKKGAVKPVNGWSVAFKGFGNYGTDYDLRALVDYVGLGANIPEDAIYPTCTVDADGNALNGGNRYVIHFDRGKTPPVNAFWSITMYDQDGFFIDNPINLYAIGDRNNLKKNSDGSVDIYIQNVSPGKDMESNWLPAPSGSFNLCLRMYWPKEEMLNGSWTPPGVKKM